MNIRIDEGLRAYIDPLTDDEREALERSLLAEGCRDALVLWGDLLVDGHNRYALCMKHGITFETRQNTRLQSMQDVHLWMIENHLGRRSVSDFQRGVLALRKQAILQARSAPPREDDGAAPPSPAALPSMAAFSRQTLAREARISSNTLGQIEKIQRAAAPELVRAVKDGAISIHAAAAVAALPPERQAAAVAGGKKALQQAARDARQAKAPRPRPAAPDIPIEHIADLPAEVARLRELLARLMDERDQLKKKVMHLTVALAEARNTASGG